MKKHWIISGLILSLIVLLIIINNYFLHVLSIFNFEFLYLPLWLWLVIVLILFFIITLLKMLRENDIEVQRVFKESLEEQAETAKKDLEKKAEDYRIEKISSAMSPTPLFNGDIVFIANLYLNKDKRVDHFFSFSKVIDYDLKNFVTVSGEKKQLVYDHSLVKVLKMYNELYKSSFSDYFLKDCLKNVNSLRNYVNQTRHCKGAYSLRLEIEKQCKNFPQYNWNDDNLTSHE